MKKKFPKQFFSGLTFLEVVVAVGIISIAGLTSIQLRQTAYKSAKASTVNSQITEEHRLLASLVATIPKIEANALFRNDPGGACPEHPRGSAATDQGSGEVNCTEDNGVAKIDDGVWEDLTETFWTFADPSGGSTSEVLNRDEFNDQVVPALTAAGCLSCHADANYFFDRTQPWGLGSSMGRHLLAPAISFQGSLANQILRHFINFEPRSYNLVTGEPNAIPNEQCRPLRDSPVVRELNGCQTNCPAGEIVPGSFSCNCIRNCCNRSGTNCNCCEWRSRFRCREPQVSQAEATCDAPLVVRDYQAFRLVIEPLLAATCGGNGVKTYWSCARNSPPPIINLRRWVVPYTVTTTWINENDKLPRSIVTRGELK